MHAFAVRGGYVPAILVGVFPVLVLLGRYLLGIELLIRFVTNAQQAVEAVAGAQIVCDIADCVFKP